MATGTLIFAAARASASALSGGTGSSTQAGSYGSSDRAISMAVAGLNRPCISTRISTSGPTASRTASTSETASRFSAGSSS